MNTILKGSITQNNHNKYQNIELFTFDGVFTLSKWTDIIVVPSMKTTKHPKTPQDSLYHL